MREYFRGNLFTNTPDINPHHLDHGRPAFVIRTVLAATLSSSYGIYSGWELCETARLGEREEYLDSEKYEIRARDWDATGNIKPLIAELNRLRHERPALQRYDNLRFEDGRPASGRSSIARRCRTGRSIRSPAYPNRWRDPVYVAVNTDPTTAEHAILHPDLPAIGIGWDEPYRLTDLLTRRLDAGARGRPAGRPRPGRRAVPDLHDLAARPLTSHDQGGPTTTDQNPPRAGRPRSAGRTPAAARSCCATIPPGTRTRSSTSSTSRRSPTPTTTGGGLRGADAEARLHRRPRRDGDLAAAVLPVTAARRRLRHRRLHAASIPTTARCATSGPSCARRIGAGCG